jgi:predicted dehydrogenase
VNFLVLGYGSIGKRHAKNLGTLGHRVRVVEPCSKRRLEAREDGHTSYKSLIGVDSLSSVDAVLICTPPKFHVSQTLWALKAGLKVFLEKPIGITLEECLEVLNLDHRHVFVGYNYHWNPQVIELKRRISQESMGKLYYCQMSMGMNLKDWHPWEDYRTFFMSSKDLGGGALLDESHFLELAIDFFGLPLSISSNQNKLSTLEIDSDDYVFTQLQYEDLTIDIKLDLFRRPHESKIEVYGAQGSLICDFIQHTNTIVSDTEPEAPLTSSEIFQYERNDIFLDMIKSFIAFVNFPETKATIPYERGIQVMMLIEKIREASLKRSVLNIEQ